MLIKCLAYSTILAVLWGGTHYLWIRVCNEKLFSYFSSKTYVVGTQKNRLTAQDGSFEHPKHMFKLIDKKIIASLRRKCLLNWPYVLVQHLATILGKRRQKS